MGISDFWKIGTTWYIYRLYDVLLSNAIFGVNSPAVLYDNGAHAVVKWQYLWYTIKYHRVRIKIAVLCDELFD